MRDRVRKAFNELAGEELAEDDKIKIIIPNGEVLEVKAFTGVAIVERQAEGVEFAFLSCGLKNKQEVFMAADAFEKGINKLASLDNDCSYPSCNDDLVNMEQVMKDFKEFMEYTLENEMSGNLEEDIANFLSEKYNNKGGDKQNC